MLRLSRTLLRPGLSTTLLGSGKRHLCQTVPPARIVVIGGVAGGATAAARIMRLNEKVRLLTLLMGRRQASWVDI